MTKSPSFKSFRKTSLPYILLTVSIMAGLYIYTLAVFLAQPPSAGFSRDIALGTLDYGFISNIQTPIVTIVNSDETLTIAAMDGHVTTFLSVDGNGTVTDTFQIDLDLYKASQLDAYRLDPATVVLYYLENDLFRVTIDMKAHTYSSTMLEQEVRSFACDGILLVLEKANGLYGLDASRGRAPVPLVSGLIQDYAVAFEKDGCHVLVGIRNDDAMDLKAISVDRSLETVKDTLISGRTRDNYLKTIQDVFVQDQVMSGLFVWTDNKYGVNHLTVQHIDLQDGSVTSSFSNSFPIHKGRFVIDEVRDGKVSIIMQENIHRGVNLVKAIMEQGRDPEVIPLTKTRELSQLSSYFEIGKEKGLVFWDSIRTTRAVKFASTQAALVKATTSILTINYLSLFGITIFVILAAAFIGTIPYLVFTSVVPLLTVLVMTRFTPDYRNKASIQNAVAGAVGTVLKLYLTWHLIHGMGRFAFRPVLIGGEPVIYLALVVSSAISWLIASVYIRSNRTYESLTLNSFVIYLVADYVQYVMMILVYVASAMILDKI